MSRKPKLIDATPQITISADQAAVAAITAKADAERLAAEAAAKADAERLAAEAAAAKAQAERAAADASAAGVTVSSPPTVMLSPEAAVATFALALAPDGWSIKVATRKGRTQTRYRVGRAFGPEAVTIKVDDLTGDELKALHDDAELIVTIKDESENEESGN
ncbi:hypothetical protein LQG66_03865 [Bradyrhizobium ontarionense]|uniref:Mu-like prophage FluMu N-terminal domain-containing protein n=1 Tax=Bradyrhizobium ontarionense TaxID=2898149 RepID=A0ABY3RFG2_9BRAD|nr:hypothetical protein [Bradyrhizobium sp. A19]UFZ05463.1 hypothetical protein LQG66_03865 [Bradyrhizobium sp. A19]